MAKDFGLSCPLCLTANDPADMLGVVIAHAIPVPDAMVGLCKRCVLVIVKSAMAAEFITPEEVFGDAPTGDSPSVAAADGAAPDSAADHLVLQDQPDSGGPGIDRREPPIPAGGDAGAESEPAERPPRRVRRHAN